MIKRGDGVPVPVHGPAPLYGTATRRHAPKTRGLYVVIRKERLARGWTQEQLADHAQLSRNQVSLIELGRVAPSIWAIKRLATALDKRPHELVKAAEDRRALLGSPGTLRLPDALNVPVTRPDH